MSRQIVGVLLVAALLQALPAVAQVKDPFSQLRRDRSSTQRTFTSGEVSGWIQYEKSYRAGDAQPVLVHIQLQVPAQLYCMSSIDFSYKLQNANGEEIRAHVRPGSGQALVPVPEIARPNGKGGYDCPYWPRRDATFPLSMDEVFPSLAPGHYTLTITLHPRDGSVPTTTLPSVTFSVV